MTRTDAAVGETVAVHRDEFAYVSHPSITILKNGDWLAGFNHTRRSRKIMHPPDDPLYRTLLCRSRDRGRSWEAPWFAPDFEWYGTNCPGLACLAGGTVIVTEFRFAWYPLGVARKRRAAGEEIAINTHRQIWKTDFDETDWDRTVNPWARGVRGTYAHISRDGAETFEETARIDCSPYGAGATRVGVIELSNGRLAYALNEVRPDGSERAVYLVTSPDQGHSWTRPVPVAANRESAFSEPCLVELSPGEILCVIRNSPEHRLYTLRSTDGGATWSAPERTPMDGLPGHVIRLSDGRLLCSYGRRKAPFGVRMCLSADGGRTWDIASEIVVRDDLPNGDLGYATTIEYDPGRLFTVYYCQEPDGITGVEGTWVDLG
jgi:hypothetical protein